MRTFLLILLAACLASCASMYMHADSFNPCGTPNSYECAKWKQDFPKEYQKYLARQQKLEADLEANRGGKTATANGTNGNP
jgi:hypothetical protein